MQKSRWSQIFVTLCVVSVIAYSVGRVYFILTDGFQISNITSDLSYNPRWETHTLTDGEKNAVNNILNQKFYYLGKGCQSYVFESEDKNYVIKFFKFQRFKIKPWVEFLSFIPAVKKHKDHRSKHKQEKMEGFFDSWRIAYDHLQLETGVLFVHLNKSDDLNQQFVLYDKMGWKHIIDLGQMEFLLQKKATMLCDTIDSMMKNGEEEETKLLLTRLVHMIDHEYKRALADNDHALMQNTGVYQGYPVHIDVGQFVIDESMKDSDISNQEFFNKTYKFRIWLQRHYPNLSKHLDSELQKTIGDDFLTMHHRPRPKEH